MISLATAMVFLFIMAASTMVVYYVYARQRECEQMERLRKTELYRRLYLDINNLGDHAIDQIIIESSGVTITSVYPAHTLLQYGFKQNGNACRNPDIARMVALVLGQDFAILSDHQTYKLRRYRIYRLNGRKEYGYAYIMCRNCKDRIFEYHHSMQLRIY